jgi:site-specific DNA recombinase
MKKYIGYIRVSTDKQSRLGTSLSEQRQAIEHYAQAHLIIVSEWYEEIQTAAKRGRRQFHQVLGLLRSGKAHGLLLHKIDRGARILRDWADLGDLIDQGVDVRFVHDNLDLEYVCLQIQQPTQFGRIIIVSDYITI